MKKLLSVLLVLFLVAFVASVTSCGKEPEKLATPVVTLEGNTALWGSIGGATQYRISLNGTISYVEGSVTSKVLTDGQSFKVQAVGDGNDYEDSAWSNTVTYTASQTPSVSEKYTVTWKNGDTILEIDTDVEYGTMPVYNGATPTKNSSAQHSYVFSGWNPTISAVTCNVTYEAQFTESSISYTITWKNGDTVLETDSNVEYGATPTYDGATPTKDSTAQYTYTFVGWSPEIATVTGDITYVAQFSESTNTYTVTWTNGGDVLETDLNVAYGTMPMYNGNIPTKSATAQYTYIFTGWSPVINVVTGDVTYSAQYSENINSYTVTFFMDDGVTILGSKTVAYGGDVTYDGSTPEKAESVSHTYTFSHWSTEPGGAIADNLKNVVDNRRVYASFSGTVKKYSVIITVNNSAYGTISSNLIENVPYGTSILTTGNSVIIGNTIVTADAKEKTSQYTFEFSGWNAPASVGAQTLIEASFSCKLNTYKVTWMNGSQTLEIDEAVTYNTTPTYNGATPTKPSDGNTEYIFSGWSPQISYVTGDIIYIATFTVKESGKLTVIFYDEDGTTELDRVFVQQGETAKFTNPLPAKEGTVETERIFEMWVTTKDGSIQANLSGLTKDTAVYAKYKTVPRKFSVTFYDYDRKFIEIQEVSYGNSAQIPNWTPNREGYKFIGWSANFSIVTSDIVVTALYEKDNTVKVTFIDLDGNVISKQRVESGKNAKEPTDVPQLEGYNQSWNKPLVNITVDTVIQVVYTLKQYKVTFTMPDGTAIPAYCDSCDDFYKQDTLKNGACPICGDKVEDLSNQVIEHGYCAISPKLPGLFVLGKSDSARVYEISGWDKSFDKITNDINITAVQGSLYESPVIIIDIDEIENTATMYVCKGQNVYLDALELSIHYNGGFIAIEEAKFNEASPLKNNQHLVNNAEKVFSFAWVYNLEQNANDTRSFQCSKVVTFKFSTDNGVKIARESFRVSDEIASTIAGSDEIIVPYVIYN
ncbi:MAG: hypothetical protein J6B29_03325 [Clostridia bacterium]|nr:hypothetical protein [Clostridia bacterium]